jgi:hypothetical protein
MPEFALRDCVKHKTCQDSRSPGRDLNPGPPKYKTGVLTAWMWRSVRLLSKMLYIRQVVVQYSDWLRAGRPGFVPRQRQKIFLLAPASRPALGPTQPLIQWVPGVLSPGVKRGRGVTLTTYPHLVPRLRMSRSDTSSPPMCLHGV